MSVHQVKKNKCGSYTRDGLDIEVVAGHDDTYPELLEKACAALNMQMEDGVYKSLISLGAYW